MRTIEFHSHEQQDEYIFNIFNGKTNGFFLDISCGNPIIGNNSYTLEKFCGWNGICFDLLDIEKNLNFSQKRLAKFIQMDATSEKLTNYLKNNIPADLVVDYVSLDVDTGNVNLALPVLKRLLASGIKFKAMTFEHEECIHGPAVRDEQRALLEAQGYVRLFEDVKAWTKKLEYPQSTEYFEDWWINPVYFDSKILETQAQGLYTFEAIEHLRNTLGNTNEYRSIHNCARSHPDEYSMYWDNNEKARWPQLRLAIKNLFNQYNSSKNP
jgi:hypothetical protein